MKRKLWLLLALAVLSGLIWSGAALAETTGQCGDNVNWSYDSDTRVLTISGTGAMWDLGSEVDSRPWGNCMESVTSVVIESPISYIGEYAFADMTSMISVTIPDSVTAIGRCAFCNCVGLTGVIIPDGVTSIAFCTFYNCPSLTSVTIPDSVTKIGNQAFSGTGLTSVIIPDGVTNIASQAFANCASLTSVVIPDGVTVIDSQTFNFCTSLASVTIPDSVTVIGERAFYACSSLTSVTIPDSVTNIGDGAFHHCTSLASVTIPDGVTTIGEAAFYNCYSLTSVTIPDSVTAIGEDAFGSCRDLACVTVMNPAAVFGDRVFSDCSSDLFMCGIADSTAQIYAESNGIRFRAVGGQCGDNVYWIVDPDTAVLFISGTGAMWDQGGSSVDLRPWDSSGIDAVITTVVIGDGVSYIGANAFRYQSHITSVSIPDSVTAIGNSAFNCCTGLTGIAIPDGVTTINADTFYDCMSLTNVTIPDSVTTIANYAFAGCTGLMDITIPDSVTSLGEYVFEDCSSLASVTLPQGITSLGRLTFYNCASLTSVTIPDSVTFIGDQAFAYCTGLTSVTVPDSVTRIDFSAFIACEGLTDVILPDSVMSLGHHAFYQCSGLTSAIVMNASMELGNSAFEQCSSDLVMYGRAGSTAHTYAEANGITFRSLPLEMVLSGSGTAGDPWLIGSKADWDQIGLAVEGGTDTAGKYFRLTADIPVTIMIGTEANPFGGHVDGDGHALNVDLTASDIGKAPFAFVSGGTFAHLRSTGTVTTSVHDASGLVGFTTGCTITDCVSAIVIDVNGGNGHAGFVGHMDGDVAIAGSLFTGSIINANTSYCAGFAGYGSGTVDDSVFDGEIIGAHDNNTFLRMKTRAGNCYYTDSGTIDRVKGQKARWVTADEGITLDFGEGTVYSVSGITAYPVGLTYNGVFCAGAGETVTMYLTAETEEGWYPFFTASAGTLTQTGGAWTLTMPEGDVVISVTYEPLSGSCGEGVSWSFDPETGTLTVSGTGAMEDHTAAEPGWARYRGLITAVVIEDGVTNVGAGAFRDCAALTEVSLPGSVTAIGKYAFSGCAALAGIELSDGVATIGASAFRDCSSLAVVTIPASVTGIGSNAFADCSSDLVICGDAGSTAEAYAAYYGIPFQAPPITGACGDGVNWTLDTAGGTLTISGAGAMQDLTSSEYPGWYDYQDRITAVVIEEGVTSVGAYAFRNMSGVESASIPDGVTSIGIFAFYGCTGLDRVDIPGSAASIGRMAFCGCTGLSAVDLAGGLETIGNNAFNGCTGLGAVEIPESVTSIGYQAFQGCSGLTGATVLNASVSIGTKVFDGCAQELVIRGYPNSTAKRHAERYGIPFESLIPGPTLVLPAGLTAIGADAFQDIAAAAVYIPETVVEIAGDPFAGSAVRYIYGAAGSAAEAFAGANGYTFVADDD